jgi:hypothetical protein
MARHNMRLDLTKGKNIEPFVTCYEDDEVMTERMCRRCVCFVQIGEMTQCFSGVDGYAKKMLY